jgi:hypothetical protein
MAKKKVRSPKISGEEVPGRFFDQGSFDGPCGIDEQIDERDGLSERRNLCSGIDLGS